MLSRYEFLIIRNEIFNGVVGKRRKGGAQRGSAGEKMRFRCDFKRVDTTVGEVVVTAAVYVGIDKARADVIATRVNFLVEGQVVFGYCDYFSVFNIDVFLFYVI